VNAAKPAAESNDIELWLDAQSLPTLCGDRERLAQVLDNLISNAVKFTPAGGRIEVRARADSTRAIIEVADTGMGISREEQHQLCERFYRTAAANEQAIQGTGLGLSITRAIVEAHGGTVGVESEVGAGTTFTVELPLAATAQFQGELAVIAATPVS
jgi:two-component system, OmpR family, phosphate regulon sensor histidine kinase PhoR